MIHTVLTVCTGNICRSPLAAFALAQRCPELEVTSAGLHALVGSGMDAESEAAAHALEIKTGAHTARQFTSKIGSEADLILVMENHHRDEIMNRWPQLTGKTFLLGHFENGQQIPDPYKLGQAMHLRAAELILKNVDIWSIQIKGI